MNNKQKLEYVLKLKKLHEIMVIKNHIYFAHQNANYNRAAFLIDNVMDQHLNEHIINTIDGTVNLSNHQEKLDEAISSALTNQRKMVLKKTNKYIDKAVENNINTYGGFLRNRISKESVSLANKIEEEARKKEYKHLSDTETKKILTEKFQNHGRRRAKNIIRDALHTNQSNISWIHGIQQGYKYKVWMNGRVKGRTRPWHKAKKIQPVHMDEFFDIYGSYPATMMYPGDLNGGAENVANCRCWLKYTNEKPNNLKTRGLFSISNNVELKTADNPKTKVTTTNQENVLEPKHKITEKIKTKIQNTVKNIKNKIKRNNASSKNKLKNNIKDSLNSKKSKPQSLYPKRQKPKKNIKDKFKNYFKKNNNRDSIDKNKTIGSYNNIKIIKDNRVNYITINEVKYICDNLPKELTKYVKEIHISEKVKIDKEGRYILGLVRIKNPNILIIYRSPGSKQDYIDTIIHEIAHTLDKNYGKKFYNILDFYGISNSSIWKKAVALDLEHNGYGFVTDYAFSEAKEFESEGYNKRIYSEDFAESIMRYFNPFDVEFRRDFPNRVKVIEQLLR